MALSEEALDALAAALTPDLLRKIALIHALIHKMMQRAVMMELHAVHEELKWHYGYAALRYRWVYFGPVVFTLAYYGVWLKKCPYFDERRVQRRG